MDDYPTEEDTHDVAEADALMAEGPVGDEPFWTDHRAILVRIQTVAILLSHLLSLSAILVVAWWISLMGGVSWEAGNAKQVFNWHPLLMIVAFCFMTVASLSFRLATIKRKRTKLIHGMSWLVAALSALVALLAVFRSHNDAVSGYIANLYSFHSWMGMVVIGLYILQFAVGVASFGGPLSCVRPSIKAVLLPFHTLVGPFVYVLTAATILLGIQEKEGFVGCSYPVTSPDTFPIQHLREIPAACLVGHLVGFLVLTTTLCTVLSLYEFRQDLTRR